MKKGSLKIVASGGGPSNSAGHGINKVHPNPNRTAGAKTGGAGGGKFK